MVRIKQRYILGELVFEDGNMLDLNQLTQRKVLENFRRSVHELYGDIGMAKIQPNFFSKFVISIKYSRVLTLLVLMVQSNFGT